MKRIAIGCVVAAVVLGCAKKEMPAAPPPAPAASNATMVTGVVEETIDSGGYTYVRLKTPHGDEWAAVNQTALTKGATITIDSQMVAQNFESQTLHRKFDHVYFGTVAGGAAPAMASPHGTPSKPVDVGDVNVPKASGPDAMTIAELRAAKSKVDVPVTVRGKVVKYLPGIMGKNWVHIRDGSDKEDITVTTTDSASVGDVVTAHGTIRRDKDVGAGYEYPVMIEDAKLTKQ